MQSVRQARRGILVFMAVLTAITFLSLWLSFHVPSPSLASVAFPMLMTTIFSYSPAFASLIARMSLRESIQDISFRLQGNWTAPAMLIAWFWPIFCGLGTYGVAWLAGQTHFALDFRGFGLWHMGAGESSRSFNRGNARLAWVCASTARMSVFCNPCLRAELWGGSWLERLSADAPV